MGIIPILCDCDMQFQYVSIQITVTLCEQTALKVHSHGAIFSECDCVFILRMEWVVWMSMMLFTLYNCDLIKKCSCTQEKWHRVNGP